MQLKGYFQPAAGKKSKSNSASESSSKSNSVEMVTSPVAVMPDIRTGTPHYRSGIATPRSYVSRAPSTYPEGDFRNGGMDDIIEIKCDVMVNWLHQQQLELMWTTGAPGEGVVLKKTRDAFTSCPYELSSERGDLFDAVRRLNVRVCLQTL
jgi:hypothetical protein